MAADRRQQLLGRRRVDVDSSDRSLRTFKNHIFRFLNVEAGASQALEHMCEHTRSIAMSNDEDVGRGGFQREVHHVRHFSGRLVADDHADGFRGDGFLCLIGRSADMRRAVHVRHRHDRADEIGGSGRRFTRVDVQSDPDAVDRVRLPRAPRSRRCRRGPC